MPATKRSMDEVAQNGMLVPRLADSTPGIASAASSKPLSQLRSLSVGEFHARRFRVAMSTCSGRIRAASAHPIQTPHKETGAHQEEHGQGSLQHQQRRPRPGAPIGTLAGPRLEGIGKVLARGEDGRAERRDETGEQREQ
jgi:hypothetical protein